MDHFLFYCLSVFYCYKQYWNKHSSLGMIKSSDIGVGWNLGLNPCLTSVTLSKFLILSVPWLPYLQNEDDNNRLNITGLL